MATTPQGNIGFGPDANCTLALCDISYSSFQYRPSLPANAIFLTLFAISGLLHLAQGFYAARHHVYSRQWFYSIAMFLGCLTEVIGYVGRILLWKNPFDFTYFLINVSKYSVFVGIDVMQSWSTANTFSLLDSGTSLFRGRHIHHTRANVSLILADMRRN